MSGSVSAGSTKSFTLQWLASEGEHSYEVRLFEVLGGQELEVDNVANTLSVRHGCDGYWTAWLEVTPTEMKGEGEVHVKVVVSYCKPFPDVGGGTYPLLDFTGSVYLDGKEIRTLNSVRDGTTLTVGTTQVVDEFDWPLTVGTHNITLKIRNTSGLPQYETTKTDNIVVRVLPLEYPLKLVSVSCSELHFNFEASDYYTKGSYVSPLECILSFENNVKITIRIQETASTDDGQLLLRVDGTMVTLYIDYTIEGMIKEVNKVIGEGVLDNTIVVRVNTRVVWADYGYEGVTLFISFLKLSKVSKVARVAEATGKIGGALTILNKLTEIPNIPKNIFLEIINNL